MPELHAQVGPKDSKREKLCKVKTHKERLQSLVNKSFHFLFNMDVAFFDVFYILTSEIDEPPI